MQVDMEKHTRFTKGSVAFVTSDHIFELVDVTSLMDWSGWIDGAWGVNLLKNDDERVEKTCSSCRNLKKESM